MDQLPTFLRGRASVLWALAVNGAHAYGPGAVVVDVRTASSGVLNTRWVTRDDLWEALDDWSVSMIEDALKVITHTPAPLCPVILRARSGGSTLQVLLAPPTAITT